MAKFKVLQPFVDIYTKELYQVNQEIDITVKRSKEIEKNLEEYEGQFIERLDTKK